MLVSLAYETMSFLPFFVGREKGFFREEGLQLDYLYRLSGGVRGGKRKAIDLCLSGEAPFFSAISAVVEAQLLVWGDVKALCASTTRGSSMFARPEIQAVSDLRGKTVMVGGGASRNEMLYLSKKQGWEVGKDLQLVHGDEVARIHAFEDPQIDAVCARVQYKVYADQNGFHQFQLLGAVWHDGGLCTSQRMIQEQPQAVQAAVNGFVRAIEFIKGNKEESVVIGARNIRWLDEAGVAAHYDTLDFSATITEAGLRWMAGLVGVAKDAARQVEPTDLADLSFQRQALARFGSTPGA